MSQTGETPRALIVAVFDPSNGKVSVNGGPWFRFRLHPGADRPVKPKEREKNRSAKDFPPPGDGDDDMECLVCRDHATCHLHLWTGDEWADLGGDCIGQFCS